MQNNRPSLVIYNRAGELPPPASAPTTRVGLWQAFDAFTERVESMLALASAKPPAPGRDGMPGREGRGIARPSIENGRLFLHYTDGTFTDVGQIVGRDGTPADPAQIAALEAAHGVLRHEVEDLRTAVAQHRKSTGDLEARLAEVRASSDEDPAPIAALEAAHGALRHEVEDLRTAVTQHRKSTGDLEARLAEAHARIEAMRPFVASDWLINGDGDLVAILADNKTRRIGHVVGQPGTPGAPGAPGSPGRDGEVKVIAPNDWTPAMMAAALPIIAAELERTLAAKTPAPEPETPRRADARRRNQTRSR